MSATGQQVEGFTMFAQDGLPGDDLDADNPLARATRRLLDGGHRFIAAIPATIADETGAPFWFGFFVLTENGRVLFFPGLPFRFELMRGGLWDGRGHFDRKFDIDHISLERDRRTWHLTDRAGRQRQGGGRTRDVGQGRLLWSCVTSSGPTDYRPLRARTVVTYRPVPNPAEAQARVDRFFACVSNGSSSALALPARPPGESVLHLGVVVAEPDSPPYSGDAMPLPLTAPGIEGTPPPPGTMGTLGTFLISAGVELQILAVWVPGRAAPGALTFSYPWHADGFSSPTG